MVCRVASARVDQNFRCRSWVSPSNAENRVWMYKSHLHLIPILYTTSPHVPRHRRSLPGRTEDSDGEGDDPHSDDEYLGPADALRLLRDPLVDTLAPPEVEVRAWERIRGYPNSALQHTHRTLAYVPRDIALALSQDPALIQRAVETFYTRDAIQLRVVHQMARFPPQTSVLTTVRMTRPAYAQLMGQKFHPPRGIWSLGRTGRDDTVENEKCWHENCVRI
ncbi:hypothetical protein BS47DRAFT_997934 [Hydnum rufescens UP504]|uniref:Uncharacterized protein n=1 Tax=Hydnum rufescens UP504 TaxID=1448309 RepID=A0A9P6BAB0_9AGAM|nr:hypothetical protein BS47DRAFT_997934 [Hydnum rufescens UP504]